MNTQNITSTIKTDRIVLVNASSAILEKVLAGDESLQIFLDINVPKQWTEFRPAPFQYALERIQKNGGDARWWSWLPILIAENTLVGNCEYKGSPKEGIVEIGYEVAVDYRGIGYATEIARALINHAFAEESIMEIVAHTLPEENASVRILKNCGFGFIEVINDPEDGQIWKWVLARPSSKP